MNGSTPDKQTVLEATRKVVANHDGKRPTKSQLVEESSIPWLVFERYFPRETMTSVLSAAGFSFGRYHGKVSLEKWLMDWGEVVRRKGDIPTRKEYKYKKYGGEYSPGVFENDRNGGAWSLIPSRFREYAKEKAEWRDVLAKLPIQENETPETKARDSEEPEVPSVLSRHSKLDNRPTYGNPIDFRGLRHEPVNEQGVVFLFGILAMELGYMVEAVQIGFPDCEAKRRIAGGRWQTVRIEFEFESRNYNHPPDGCDVIVCWRHNWRDCPDGIEVIELSSVIKTLAKSEN